MPRQEVDGARPGASFTRIDSFTIAAARLFSLLRSPSAYDSSPEGLMRPTPGRAFLHGGARRRAAILRALGRRAVRVVAESDGVGVALYADGSALLHARARRGVLLSARPWMTSARLSPRQPRPPQSRCAGKSPDSFPWTEEDATLTIPVGDDGAPIAPFDRWMAALVAAARETLVGEGLRGAIAAVAEPGPGRLLKPGPTQGPHGMLPGSGLSLREIDRIRALLHAIVSTLLHDARVEFAPLEDETDSDMTHLEALIETPIAIAATATLWRHPDGATDVRMSMPGGGPLGWMIARRTAMALDAWLLSRPELSGRAWGRGRTLFKPPGGDPLGALGPLPTTVTTAPPSAHERMKTARALKAAGFDARLLGRAPRGALVGPGPAPRPPSPQT